MKKELRDSRGRHRSKPLWGKVLFAVVTFLNILLTIILKVMDRQQVVKAVKEKEDVQLLLRTEKSTSVLKQTDQNE